MLARTIPPDQRHSDGLTMLTKEQAQKLLTTGKTDLLEGFISKRGRPFSAYLKFEDGKVGFEFPERTTAVSESK